MTDAFIVDAIRTPFGRFGGSLAGVRADDLGALPIAALIARNPGVDWAGRRRLLRLRQPGRRGQPQRGAHGGLLAGLPASVPGSTINRLCGSSLDAVGMAARAIRTGEAHLIIAGGVESMTRAPFVMAKADTAFSRTAKIEDTTIGWRFVNPKMKAEYGIDSMPETAENVAKRVQGIAREDQDTFALRSQQRWAAAHAAGVFKEEIVPVTLHGKKGESRVFDTDEHPRPDVSLEGLAKLKGVVTPDGSVTAGNASGVNDGACALLLASQAAVDQYKPDPACARGRHDDRRPGAAHHGLRPGAGDQEAAADDRLDHRADGRDRTERSLRLPGPGGAARPRPGATTTPRVNPNGGAIALGHPLGASGARLVTAAVNQLHRTGGRYALCTMCIGVGQGIALIVERV
jgi:acetyl-CoA acyltransferase